MDNLIGLTDAEVIKACGKVIDERLRAPTQVARFAINHKIDHLFGGWLTRDVYGPKFTPEAVSKMTAEQLDEHGYYIDDDALAYAQTSVLTSISDADTSQAASRMMERAEAALVKKAHR